MTSYTPSGIAEMRKFKKWQSLLIPVEMCEYAITHKLVRPFQLYVFLKGSCSGKLRITNDCWGQITASLGLKSIKTVRNNLKILQRQNWVGYSSNSKIYFIRGFEPIRTMYGFKSRTAAEFYLENIEKFKAFVAGAIIGHLANQQKRRAWMSERKNRRSKHLIYKPASFFPVASRALAKILRISVSTAHKFKRLAHQAQYIQLEKCFYHTNISTDFVKTYIKRFPEDQPKVRCMNGKIILQESDLVLPLIRYKRRKKIEQYNPDKKEI